MPQQEGEDYKKYNHAKAIRQQIRHVNDKIGEADMEDAESFNNYFYKVYMSLAALDAVIEPFKDDDYTEKLTEEDPISKDTSGRLQFVHATMKEIMNLLDRQNIFYESNRGRDTV